MHVGPDDYRACADELRGLLATGLSLGDAIREMHLHRGLGLVWLARAVMAVQECSLPEAQRLVVKESFR